MNRIIHSCCFMLLTAFSLCAAPQVTVTINAGKPVHAISPYLYGVFFEDINYAADGGLYAEMVQNRSFEFYGDNGLFGWKKIVPGNGAAGSFAIETNEPVNENNPHYLRIVNSIAGQSLGIANSGYDGISLKKGSNYLFSVWARTLTGSGELSVRLEDSAGKLLASASVAGLSPRWNKFTVVLCPSESAPNATLVILDKMAGTIDLDMVSLFPQDTFKNRPNGLRADLAQMIADLKPAFFRFPGGCIVEGKDWDNRYQWKDTIGDVAERKMNWNLWKNPRINNGQYYQSYGLGFFEYFQFSEDIGAEPLPVLNCGMACQFRSKEMVPLDKLDPYIQDALDLIEFANGSPETKWGAKRAVMGHPKPFNMKYLSIGNEQWGEDFLARYDRFAAAIRAQHPEIRLVGSAGPFPDGTNFEKTWAGMTTANADVVDEHFYKLPSWFYEQVNRYDKYDRKKPKVFVGEYAARPKIGKNILESALAEAAFLTGVERNADIVEMTCYAPLFANKNFHHSQDVLIWFDDNKVVGSPSYYLEQLFNRNRGDVLLSTEVANTNGSSFYATASRDLKTGQVIIKAVNPGAEPVDANIRLQGLAHIASKGQCTVLSGKDPNDENTFTEPKKIAPVSDSFQGVSSKFSYTFKPYSVTVLRIDAAQ